MPELVFLRRGEEFLGVGLDRSRTILGRAESSDIIIPDPSLAGQQVAVLFDGAAVMVEDLSGQGTLVSGRRADQAAVSDGAEIALGQWRAAIHGLAVPDAAPRPSRENPQRWCAQGSMAGTVRVFGAEPRTSVPGSGREGVADVLLGDDPGMRQLADSIERVALSQSVVSIFGESGTGRELVARTLHARSGRSQSPFLRVNCRTVRTGLLAELFSFGAPNSDVSQEAEGGTLYLHEVGALSLDLQSALLLALESWSLRRGSMSSRSRLDTRVVVATSEDLLSATRLGLFREDLYDLLCMAPLILPPLRHRRGDIPALAEQLLKTFTPRGQEVRLTQEALDRLVQHPWPGNLRELRAVIQRALLLRSSPTLDVSELHFEVQPNRPDGRSSASFVPGLTLEQMLRELEREIIESALRHFDNNRERVARELGVARSTLFKRLKDWGLTKHDTPRPAA